MPDTPADYNATIIAEFRANEGRVGGTWDGTPLLLLHHTGASSGVNRVNPIAYLPDGLRYLIWAANGGAPSHPGWYHNLAAHPNTSIEVGGEALDVVAEEAIGAERDRLWEVATERYPHLIEAAGKSGGRVIPLIVLIPVAQALAPGAAAKEQT